MLLESYRGPPSVQEGSPRSLTLSNYKKNVTANVKTMVVRSVWAYQKLRLLRRNSWLQNAGKSRIV